MRRRERRSWGSAAVGTWWQEKRCQRNVAYGTGSTGSVMAGDDALSGLIDACQLPSAGSTNIRDAYGLDCEQRLLEPVQHGTQIGYQALHGSQDARDVLHTNRCGNACWATISLVRVQDNNTVTLITRYAPRVAQRVVRLRHSPRWNRTGTPQRHRHH